MKSWNVSNGVDGSRQAVMLQDHFNLDVIHFEVPNDGWFPKSSLRTWFLKSANDNLLIL